MIFKGTDRFTGEALSQEVQAAGGQWNAYTSFDRTVYYIDGPAKSLDLFLSALIEMVFRPSFPEEEYEKEKDVIRREIAMGLDDPDSHIIPSSSSQEDLTQRRPAKSSPVSLIKASARLLPSPSSAPASLVKSALAAPSGPSQFPPRISASLGRSPGSLMPMPPRWISFPSSSEAVKPPRLAVPPTSPLIGIARET